MMTDYQHYLVQDNEECGFTVRRRGEELPDYTASQFGQYARLTITTSSSYGLRVELNVELPPGWGDAFETVCTWFGADAEGLELATYTRQHQELEWSKVVKPNCE